MKQGEIEERHHAGQAVDADLRVGPMIHRLPDKSRVLGPAESGLDLVAIPVGPDDLLRAPVHMIRKDNVFPCQEVCSITR